jgi:hypothetical protein
MVKSNTLLDCGVPSDRGVGFKWGFIIGLILFVGSFALVSYASPFPNTNMGEIFFQPGVAGFLALLLVVDVLYGLKTNREWNGLIAGAIIAMYLVSIYGTIASIV